MHIILAETAKFIVKNKYMVFFEEKKKNLKKDHPYLVGLIDSLIYTKN